ncbi:hypothetical protein [Streptomyces spiramyceticus]|uniref:hypothetical protein n=1 Tax=Streptomyces spiramyceticus TaxID=299717 RepID=UPI00237B3DAD|nr:hypothetical protein [Streptomyces spiramyceticus]
MDGGRSTRRWSLDEKNWSRGWWIPLVVVVLAAATWGFLGFVEGGCKRGPRGGCVAADGYELRSWVLFLASMPTLFVVGTGLTAGRWPPALGVAAGGAACGLYTLAQGHTVPHLIMAAVLFALAITAPALAWRRRRAARAE